MDEIADLVEAGHDAAALAAIAALNADTGDEHTFQEFHDGICGSSAGEMAVRAARPVPHRISGPELQAYRAVTLIS